MFSKSVNLKIPAYLAPKTPLLPLSKYRALPNIDPNDYLVNLSLLSFLDTLDLQKNKLKKC